MQVVVKECTLVEVTLALVDKNEQWHLPRPSDEERQSALEQNAALKDCVS